MKTNTTTKRKGFVAKLVALIAAAVIIVGVSVTLTACSASTASFALGKTDIFAFAGMTTGQLLGDMGGTASASSAVLTDGAADGSTEDTAGATEDTTGTTEDTTGSTEDTTGGNAGEVTGGNEADAEMTEILDRYMEMADVLVSGGITQETAESDDPAYQYKMTVTVSDALGIGGNYVMYYNETFEDEYDRDDDDRRDRDRDRDHDDDDERESVIEGKLIVGENEYAVYGKRETEEEHGESEIETELTAYADESTYVTFKQEIENDEQSFEYEIVKNGRTVDEFEIEIETKNKVNKNGKVTMEMEKLSIELIDDDGVPVEFELKFKNMTVNGENKVRISVEYEKGGFEGEFDVEAYVAEDGSVAYRYYMTDCDIEIGHRYGRG